METAVASPEFHVAIPPAIREALGLQPEATPTPLGPSAAVEAVRQLPVSDPGMALAELRIELERMLRRLHARTRQPASSPGSASLTKIIRDFAANGVLSQNLAASIHDVMQICNRAIHGEDIRSQDALVIVETGGELREGLEEGFG